MENYTRTAQDVVLSAQAPSSPNEVLCSAHGKVTAYVDVACAMLDRDGDNARVVIVGKGKGINKAVSTAEALKRKVSGLYQDTRIASEQVVDRWEPVAEKLDVVQVVRHTPVITITMSRDPIDPSAPGYQPPKDAQPAPTSAPVSTSQPATPQQQQRKGQSNDAKRSRR